MANNDGGPAFPHYEVKVEGPFQMGRHTFSGMSLRDYFAGQALAGLCAATFSGQGGFSGGGGTIVNCEQYAIDAYGFADAMLKAREATHG